MGYGTREEHEIPIEEFIQAEFLDHRVVSVQRLSDDSYVIAVENLPSSGRAGQQTMRLSKESMTAVVTTILMFLQMKGERIDDLLREAVSGNNIQYRFSENLDPFQPMRYDNEEQRDAIVKMDEEGGPHMV